MTVLLILIGLVVIPASISFIVFGFPSHPFARKVRVGDPIVYTKYKASTQPGVRARDSYPSQRGDYYYYLVNKFWTVADILEDGRIVARTRTDKVHYLNPDDPNLRRARLVERLKYGHRFPRFAEAVSWSRRANAG